MALRLKVGNVFLINFLSILELTACVSNRLCWGKFSFRRFIQTFIDEVFL